MKPKQPTPDTPVALMQPPAGYTDWLADLKGRSHSARAARHAGR